MKDMKRSTALYLHDLIIAQKGRVKRRHELLIKGQGDEEVVKSVERSVEYIESVEAEFCECVKAVLPELGKTGKGCVG